MPRLSLIGVFICIFICIVPIIHSCREVVWNIVIEVKYIFLGVRVFIWIIVHVVVLIDGLVITVSEYETPAIFIIACHTMDTLFNIFRHQ